MKEYQIVRSNGQGAQALEQLETHLNRLAGEDWRAISISHDTLGFQSHIVLLEREKTSSKEG